MLKRSRFTVDTYNEKHELLLYNSMQGTESFCKLHSYENIEFFLSEKYSEMTKKSLDVLEKKGILVD